MDKRHGRGDEQENQGEYRQTLPLRQCGGTKTTLIRLILNYNFNLKLRAIGRVPPFEAMLHWYNKSPSNFTVNPAHLIVGLNS